MHKFLVFFCLLTKIEGDLPYVLMYRATYSGLIFSKIFGGCIIPEVQNVTVWAGHV